MQQTPFTITTIKAIIGLGNPGPQYAKHRHSIGFRIVDELVQQANGTWRIIDDIALAEIQLPTPAEPQKIIVIKPQRYMNNSGYVAPFLHKKGISSEEILVIHDELEKEFGIIQIRLGGSARGHKGLKSLISAVGESFWRLRFGIARPTDKADVPNYVLTNFTQEEETLLPELIQKACKVLIL
jgi:PTH1 family peptidyl-tRNA hydrolase